MKQRERNRIVKSVLGNMEDHGVPLEQAIKSAGIGRQTWYDWSKRDGMEWILDASRELTKASHVVDTERVEKQLFQRALGYIHIEREYRRILDGLDTDTRNKHGLILYRELHKPVPGNMTALIFLLCNLAREGLTSIDFQNIYDIQIDRSKLDSVDDLIDKMFRDDKKEAKKENAKSPYTRKSSRDKTISGESKEEQHIRERICLEMSDESGMVGEETLGD